MSLAEEVKPAVGGELDAFVSYSHRDRGRVEAIVRQAESRGRTLWIDADGLPPGAPWRRELGTAIEAADAMVCCISPSWQVSVECAAEYQRASQLGKRVIPVLLHDTTEVHADIQALQWIDARDADVDDVVARLLMAIDHNIERVREHTHWLSRALRWENRNRDASLLLRGNDLAEAEAWLARPGPPSPSALHADFVVSSRHAESRRRRRIRTIAALSAVAAVIAGVVILSVQHTSNRNQHVASSRALATYSVGELAVDPERSLLLALAAWHADHTPQALQALQQAYVTPRPWAAISGVNAVRLSWVENKMLLAVGADGTVRTWDERGARRGTTNIGGHVGSAAFDTTGRTGVAVENDGRAVAWTTSPTSGSVHVYPTLVPGGAVTGGASPDGGIVAVGTSDGVVKTWSLPDMTENDVRTGQQGGIQCLAIAAGGEPVIAGGGDGTVMATTTTGSTLVGRLGSPITRCSASADGSVVTAIDLLSEGAVWHTGQQAPLKTLDHVFQSAVSPDGSHVAAAGTHHGVQLYDTAQWNRSSVLPDSSLDDLSQDVSDIHFSTTGTSLGLSLLGGATYVASVPSGRIVATMPAPGEATQSMAMSPSGQYVATTSSDGKVRIWSEPSVPIPVVAGISDGDQPAQGNAESFTPDGRTSITATNDQVRFADARTGGQPTVCPPVPQCRSETPGTYFTQLDAQTALVPYSSALVSRDGRHLTLASRFGVVQMWSLDDFQPEWTTTSGPPAKPIESLVPSPDGTRLVAVVRGAPPIELSARTGRVVSRFGTTASAVTAAAFLEDGQIVTGDSEGTVRVWTAPGRSPRQVAKLDGAAYSMAVAPDGKSIAASSGSNVNVIRIADRRVVSVLTAGVAPVTAVAYSPDGRFIATGSGDETVELWNADTATKAQSVLLPSAVNGLAFDPAGTKLGVTTSSGSTWLIPCALCTSPSSLSRSASRERTRPLTKQERVQFGLDQ